MGAGRAELELHKVDRLAALARAFAGTPEGDAAIGAVDALSRQLRASGRRHAEVEVPHDPVVALASDDELAGRASVGVGDLADRHLLQNPDEVPEWRDVATELVGPTIRTSRSFALGPLATLDEQLDHVAVGNGIIIVSRSRAQSSGRTDVALVAVEGIAPRRHHTAR